MLQQPAAKKRPPGKEREADAKSSRPSKKPRLDQTRRRSWGQRAQDTGTQTGKPIRLNRVPLLRAETSGPGPSARQVPGLAQAVVLVSSSSSRRRRRRRPDFPYRKRAPKRGRPTAATEQEAPESPPAKRRRMDDGPAQNAGSGGSSQVASRVFYDPQPPRSQVVFYIPPWILPRSQPGPIRTRHIWWRQLREKKPYSRPDNQSKTRRAPAPDVRPPRPSK